MAAIDSDPELPIMGASEPAVEPVITVPHTPEPPPAPAGVTQEEHAAALAKARQEEKDKLYRQMELHQEGHADLAEGEPLRATRGR